MVRFMGQANAEASMPPAMDLLKEKKKKKKKKIKEEEAEELEMENTFILPSPKKKKKKKKENEDPMTKQVENEPTLDESQEGVTEVKKKKKKKKKQVIEDNNNEEATGQTSSSGRPPSDSTTKRPPADEAELLPRKKKQKRAPEQSPGRAGPEEPRKGAAAEDEAKDRVWTMDEELTILERMRSQLPENDRKSCRVTLKNIDWKAVSFDGRSRDECKSQFGRIFAKINVMKSLTTILQEAQEFVQTFSKRRRRVMLPRHRFLKDYIGSNRKELVSAKGEDYLRMANKAWKRLPEEERAAYQADYDEELRKLGLTETLETRTRAKKAARDDGPISLPRSPYEIWSAEEGEARNSPKDVEGKKPNAKAAFTNIKRQKKMHYIRLSLGELLTFQKKAEEYVKDHPDYKVSRILGPVKEELKFYLEGKGMPICPPSKPYLLYYQMKVESGEIKDDHGSKKLMTAQSIFKALPDYEKAKYKDMLSEMLGAYNKELNAWEEEQDETTLYARERFFAKRKILDNSAGSASAPRPEVFANTVTFDMSCPKFHDEPLKAPKTPFSLFCLRMEDHPKQKGKTKVQKNKICREYWTQMKDKQKQAYVERCAELRKRYEEQVLRYVEGMSKKMRKVYLGFHRTTLCAYFQRDVFEELYPNAKYPVYVTSPRKKRAEEEEEEGEGERFTGEPPEDARPDGRKEGRSSESGDAPERKKVRRATGRAHVSVTNPSESDEEESLLASPARKTAGPPPAEITLLSGLGERGSDTSDEDSSDSGAELPSKSSLKHPRPAKKGSKNPRSSSDDSDAGPPGMLPRKGPRTAKGGRPTKSKSVSSSDDDESDVEVRPAWESQVRAPPRKPADDSSSDSSDSV